MKKVNLFVPQWWNPLFWVFVALMPILSIVFGAVLGVLYGIIMGYERGLGATKRKLNRFIATLP